MDWKEHDGYVIVNEIPVYGKVMMLGVHQKEGRQFVTWEHREQQYMWAHYFTDHIKATEDMCRRALQEIEYIRNKEMYRETHYSFTGFIKNGRNATAIEFPTNELQDILGSIGILDSAGVVCLNGQYTVKLEPERDKFADALIHVLRETDSLHTVNELAKAAYHSDYRVYLMLEENLKQGKYHTTDQLFQDVEDCKEHIRQTSKEHRR